jgi:hypothetical protein
MARWAYKSANIIKNIAVSKNMSYFYNSGYHIDSQNLQILSNSNNSKADMISSIYILDHYTHVENVSYGICRDKGDSTAHFGYKARSAMVDSLMWMLYDICNLDVKEHN